MARPVVFYDDDCGFCRWSAARLRAWDRRGTLAFAPIRSSVGDEVLRELTPDARDASWHVARGGRVWSSGAALTEVLRYLPGGAPLSALTAAFPDTTEWAYAAIARNRTRLGTLLGQRACSVDPSRTQPAAR
jgi:predicted DCC family thiol-disulfide oxidoreductase YuxK